MDSDPQKSLSPASSPRKRGEENLGNENRPAQSSVTPKEIKADRFETQETMAPPSESAGNISAIEEEDSIQLLQTTEPSVGLGSSSKMLGKRKRSSSPESNGEDEASKQTAFMKGRETWHSEIMQGRYHARRDTGWNASMSQSNKRLRYNHSGPATLQYDQRSAQPHWDLKHAGQFRQWPCWVELSRKEPNPVSWYAYDFRKRGECNHNLRAIFVPEGQPSAREVMYRVPSLSLRLQAMFDKDQLISDDKDANGQRAFSEFTVTFPFSKELKSGSNRSQAIRNFSSTKASMIGTKSIHYRLKGLLGKMGDKVLERSYWLEWDCDAAIATNCNFESRFKRDLYQKGTNAFKSAIELLRKSTGHGGHIKLFVLSPELDMIQQWVKSDLLPLQNVFQALKEVDEAGSNPLPHATKPIEEESGEEGQVEEDDSPPVDEKHDVPKAEESGE